MREEDTASYKLFHVKHFISIPSLYIKPPEYYEVYGRVDLGNATDNHINMMQYEATYKTAAEIAILVQDGVVVRGLTEDLANEIYLWIAHYLQDWLNIASTDHNRQDFPLDWIDRFTMLQNALAPLADVAENIRPVNTLFKRQFGAAGFNFNKEEVKPVDRTQRKTSVIGQAIEQTLHRRGKL